jgi:hypothetical protein
VPNGGSGFFVYYQQGDLEMLATVQEKAVASSGNAPQRAYTVEEVFAHIDKKLIDAFGEGFGERLSFWIAGKNKFLKK